MALPFVIKGYQAIPFPITNGISTTFPTSSTMNSSCNSSSSLLHSYVYMKPHTGKNYIKACIVEGVHVEEKDMTLRDSNNHTLLKNKKDEKQRKGNDSKRTLHETSNLYEHGINNLPSTYLNFSSVSERYKSYNEMKRKEYWIPTERTLFIANIPLETITTQGTCRIFLSNLRKILSSYGEVEGIYLDYSVSAEHVCHHLDPIIGTNRNNTSTSLASNAYIVFVKSKSVKLALKNCKEFFSIISSENNSLERDNGLEEEKNLFQTNSQSDMVNNSKSNIITNLLYKRIEDRPMTEDLEEDVDEYMAEFERKEREEEEKRLAMLNGEPDEDGFITVVPKKRKALIFDEEESRQKEQNKFERKYARRAGRGKKKKDNNKMLSTFYTHQLKETKKKQLEQLRIRFQEDKIRIQKMKEARKFNPFK